MISPANQGKQSVVKHMLAIDWKFWKSCILSSSARAVTIKMLGRIAGILLIVRAFLYIVYNILILILFCSFERTVQGQIL